MNDIKIYYRFLPIGVDYTSEKDIKSCSKILESFDDLSERFCELKIAYETAGKERADIILNILPDIYGVTELSVYHKVKRKFFSKEIKKQCFSLSVTRFENLDKKHALYCYETTDFEQVKRIFEDIISNRKPPNLKIWKRII